ncbi:MAG: glycine cleavage system aminomethyltransferase GcvT [Alphaproteobacteria bacterium]
MTALQNTAASSEILRTPLYHLHLELGAKMVPFAGYEMPVQYPQGLLKEHLHTREAAGLFDVSHMGQALLVGESHEQTATMLETLVPADIIGLERGQQRYTQLLNEEGGIIDDLIVTRSPSPEDDGTLMLVVNADRKDLDYAHLHTHLADGIRLDIQENLAMIALQGPAAATVMDQLCPKATTLPFMGAMAAELAGLDCHVSRSGYTGEDGFEISLDDGEVEEAARALLSHPAVKPIGLGARDTLRLEAGLCLYGHELDTTTSPVEAALVWSMGKRRREEGGFPGAHRIQRELREGPKRKRVGIRLTSRAPAREGCEILGEDGKPVGQVTSGSYSPSLSAPVAMGYVDASHAKKNTPLQIVIRGTPHPATVAPLPFIPNKYFRKS